MLDPAAGPVATRSIGFTTTRPRPGTVVLEVRGEIDAGTAPELDAVLTGLESGSGPAPVVDLTGVSFLASRGLAVLIGAADRAEVRGERLRLVAPSHAVRRALQVTGSDRLFAVHATVTAAVGPTG